MPGVSDVISPNVPGLDPTLATPPGDSYSNSHWARDRALPSTHFDVIVYGGTEAGLGSACGAADMGLTVLFVSENDRLGGMFGGGINQSDVKSSKAPHMIVGFAREVYRNIAHDEQTTYSFKQWVRDEGPLRPSRVARQIGKQIGKRRAIRTLYNRTLVSAPRDNVKRINTVTFVDDAGKNTTFTCTTLVDAGYPGDLARLGGFSNSVGRESQSYKGESLAGFKGAAAGWPSPTPPDIYNTPGVPASGYCWPLVDAPTTAANAGDGLLMGFGVRLFMTSDANDKVPVPDPDMSTYDPKYYELLVRDLAANVAWYTSTANDGEGARRIFQFYDLFRSGGTPFGPTYLRYVDFNASHPLSLNLTTPAERRAYVDGDRAFRTAFLRMFKNRILGIFYAIRTDPRVPAAIKTLVAAYGFSNKEWQKYGGSPPELYVREGYRIVGDNVMHQGQITSFINGLAGGVSAGSPSISNAPYIARAYYDIDAHYVQLYAVGGLPKAEGATLNSLGDEAGAPIPWWVLLPKKSESTCTLHPGAFSVTQVVWRSLRMGPIQMAIGYAAGIVAFLAIDGNCAVQDIDSARLGRILDLDEIWQGLAASPDGANYVQAARTETGTWTNQSGRFGFIGNNAKIAAVGSNAKVRYAPKLNESGTYRIIWHFAAGSASPDRASSVTINIVQNGVTTTRTVSQLYPEGSGGMEDLGLFYFRKGVGTASPTSLDYVEIDTTGADGIVSDGGMVFIPVKG